MSETRRHFGLTQTQYAAQLGVNRTTLALVESGRRSMPVQPGNLQALRLGLAQLGRALDAQNRVLDVPPLPEPAPEREPLAQRLRQCRHQQSNLRFELENLRRRAAPFLNRLAALPALRAWQGPVKSAEREARWLASIEAEAHRELLDVCGSGPQLLLQTRLAGLEHEISSLEAAIDALPPRSALTHPAAGPQRPGLHQGYIKAKG